MTLTVRDNLPLFINKGKINEKIFNFSYFDKIVNFATENNMQIRLHTLVWHKHFPKILESCNREQCLQFLDTYFYNITNRYSEKIFSSIDVLNEICSDINSEEFKNGEILRRSPWKDKLGNKYYLDILKLARKYFPYSNLVYNEYDEINEKKRQNMISIVNEIKLEESISETELLNSIGLQSHYHEYTKDEEIKKAYKELSSLNKSLQISELDITKINSNDDIQINRITGTILECAISFDVDYITCWGPSSKISWQSNKVRTFLDKKGNIDKSFKKFVNAYSMKSHWINNDINIHTKEK